MSIARTLYEAVGFIFDWTDDRNGLSFSKLAQTASPEHRKVMNSSTYDERGIFRKSLAWSIFEEKEIGDWSCTRSISFRQFDGCTHKPTSCGYTRNTCRAMHVVGQTDFYDPNSTQFLRPAACGRTDMGCGENHDSEDGPWTGPANRSTQGTIYTEACGDVPIESILGWLKSSSQEARRRYGSVTSTHERRLPEPSYDLAALHYQHVKLASAANSIIMSFEQHTTENSSQLSTLCYLPCDDIIMLDSRNLPCFKCRACWCMQRHRTRVRVETMWWAT